MLKLGGQFPLGSQIMKYRNFGKIDFKSSALGFGTMRFPVIGENSAKIDESQTKEMIYYAVDNGINYLDTAYVYHQGQSEVVLGKILKDGHREKVKIATKLPVWLIAGRNDLDIIFEEQLRRLQTDHIDFYLLHSLNEEKWSKVLDLRIIEWLEKKVSQGKINYLGFSFHDQYPLFEKIIDSYNKWTFCQIQYNLLDENEQAGVKGLKYAAQKGLAVIIMEPLKGGKLAHAPKKVQEIWDQAKSKKSSVDWALSWLWNQPEISLVLSGMSNLNQVKENIKSASKSEINSLTNAEVSLIKKVQKKYQELISIPCTKCGYCLPCPKKVNIPKIFEIYNEIRMYDNLAEGIKKYSSLNPEEKIENCVSCKRCESLCPQKIKISEKLKEVKKFLANDK